MAESRIDPWSSFQVKDYGEITKKFGIKKFDAFRKRLSDAPPFMRRGIVFGHRNFERIMESMEKKKPFIMMTGFMPSGKFHIGHKMLVEQVVYYQKLGAKIFLCAADIEAYNVRRMSLEELRKTAIEEYLINYIALGLKPKNCDFYFQSHRSGDGEKASAYYRLSKMVSRSTTLNEIRAVYGDISPAKMVSVFTQVADILHPQLKEFGGPRPVLVPVGIDQDPHIRLTRDIASRLHSSFNFILPSSTYHEFMIGLKGGKMSSSDPTSYIALTDTPEQVKEKIMKYAFSGGGNSLEEHRKKGGNPDVDVAFQILYFGFEPDDRKIKKIRDDYRSGKLLTGELKAYAIEKINSFLEKHMERREKARDRVSDFLDRV